MKKQNQELATDPIIFAVPENMTDATDLAGDLYDQFMTATDAATKKELMKNHNLCVVAVNKAAGKKILAPLTMKSAAPAPAAVTADAFINGTDEKPKTKKAAPKKTPVVLTKTGKVATNQSPVVNIAPKGKGKKSTQQKVTDAMSNAGAAIRVEGEPKPGTKTAQILDHHRAGKTNKEIIALGFTPSVVSWQIALYKKRLEAKSTTKK